MVAKLPVTARPPRRAAWPGASTRTSGRPNPFTGAYLAVVESVAKLVAAGFTHEERLPDLPGVLRAPARRARALGQARRGRARRAHGPGRSGRGRHRRQGLHVRLLRGPGRPADARLLRRRPWATPPRDLARVQGRGRIAWCASLPAAYGDDWRPDAAQLLDAFALVERLIGRGGGARRVDAGLRRCAPRPCSRCAWATASAWSSPTAWTPTACSRRCTAASSLSSPTTPTRCSPSPRRPVVEPIGTTTEAYVLAPPARASTSPGSRRPGRASSRACSRTVPPPTAQPSCPP